MFLAAAIDRIFIFLIKNFPLRFAQFFGLFFASTLQGQSDQLLHRSLSYYLPDIEYDTRITSPEEYLGFQIGEWHIDYYQLMGYMQLLARESDRISIETYGYSHEKRPLLLLKISTPDKLQRIESIRQEHMKLVDAKLSAVLDIASMPLVLYQGYSIHGNESSGASAAILMAYYLAAGKSDTVEQLLDNTVILLDPCYNPDGLNRFASWVNMHRSKTLVSDPNDREYKEVWPKGRTNHYWTDLNRDWLLLTHPESRARIASFQKWLPNILTDHHEMGKNSTFFFQPGVPERTNPNTPQRNQDLTEEIGHYHAQALDNIGSKYFTKKRFDDYYYGKGSTYPDIQGSIGILFEQASSRGHYQQSVNGILDFPFTIRNQVVTSLSTQQAAVDKRIEILQYMREFYQNANKTASAHPRKAYQIPKSPDYNKAKYFADLLRIHDIEIYDDQSPDGYYYIPWNQRQYRLIQTIFERVHNFRSKVFYDVSTWTFPLAFDLAYTTVNTFDTQNYSLYTGTTQKGQTVQDDSAVSYILDWRDWKSSRMLAELLRNKVAVHRLDKTFKLQAVADPSLKKGNMLIHSKGGHHQLILKLAKAHELELQTISAEEHQQIMASGSTSLMSLPSIAMLVGEGVFAYDAGDIWFHLDQRMELPVTKIDLQFFKQRNLKNYQFIILPHGNYKQLDAVSIKKIEDWVNRGGTLIAFREAIQQLQYKKLLKLQEKASANSLKQDKSKRAQHLIGGAIFETKIDPSSDLSWGMKDQLIPIFKKGDLALETLPKATDIIMSYTERPLMSGYTSTENQARISKSPALFVYKKGKGQIIGVVDNLLFRGYWLGAHKLFDNLIYFSNLNE